MKEWRKEERDGSSGSRRNRIEFNCAVLYETSPLRNPIATHSDTTKTAMRPKDAIKQQPQPVKIRAIVMWLSREDNAD
ncbi:hypothetical protein BLNAU_12325 [Blattamonas nauphoetae]|uniref:Uncharacterized protein n=1 Tax=Blattamonas nauphoetae TaxID=2049346 RepID=A0ABQ9XQU6_9EUKA|nr:hypothetical protein BLNAU_12325 [Blattamonas nauphoetae]